MATVAEQIAGLFGDDGQRWEDAGGRTLEDACECHPHHVASEYHEQRELTRYRFDDGSAITAAPGGWDLGYENCFCWQGAGHDTTTCEALSDENRAHYAAARCFLK